MNTPTIGIALVICSTNYTAKVCYLIYIWFYEMLRPLRLQCLFFFHSSSCLWHIQLYCTRKSYFRYWWHLCHDNRNRKYLECIWLRRKIMLHSEFVFFFFNFTYITLRNQRLHYDLCQYDKIIPILILHFQLNGTYFNFKFSIIHLYEYPDSPAKNKNWDLIEIFCNLMKYFIIKETLKFK